MHSPSQWHFLLCVTLWGWIYKEDKVRSDLKNSLRELRKRLQDPQGKWEEVNQQKQELRGVPE